MSIHPLFSPVSSFLGLALTTLLAAGCSQLLTARAPAAEPDLTYTLRLLAGSPRGVAVTLIARGGDDGRTVLKVAEEWGGIRVQGDDIHDVQVRTADGRELALEHPHTYQWTVQHAPREPLTINYTVRPPADRTPLERANDYRTHVTETLFHMIGNHGLIFPEHLQGSQVRTVRLAWEGFEEAGWKVASSHGPGAEAVTVSMSLDDFRHALFLAGDVRFYERDIHGRKLGVALYGREWRFRDEEFVDLVARIVQMEREFFCDHRDPWYLVSLVPTGDKDPGSLSIGGTAVTNCFALFVSQNAALGKGEPGAEQIPRLLAHEYFHRWNGGRYRAADPEQAIYWFSEGFTDFYARRLMLRSGIITPAEYAADLNESIRNYYLSPVRTAPNSRIVADFWTDRDVGGLPYRRGDLIALLLDETIREKSGGKRSLDDFMRELLAGGEDKAVKLDNEVLFARIEHQTGPEFVESLRSVVVDGAEVPIPAKLHEPALTRTTKQAYAFDLGFDESASREAKEVKGVRPQSAAHAAGLRDGQRMLGWSVHFGNVDREVELTVEENGARKVIRYLPRGPAVEVPFFEP